MDLGCCGDESGPDCAQFVNYSELHKISRLQLSIDMCGEVLVGGGPYRWFVQCWYLFLLHRWRFFL